MITFFILRVLDVWSTLLSVETFGVSVETNPVSRFWLERGLFVPWQIFFTIAFCLLLVRFNSRPVRIGLGVFNVATTIVVALNFISYFIAKELL
jgi:hypothetical protein